MENVISGSMSVDTDDHPHRVRTMTGSSMGSFSSYLQEKETPRLMVLTSHHHQNAEPVQISPDARISNREEELERELQEARWQRTEALESLRQLAEGVRLVTRQIKQSHNQAQGAATRAEEEEESLSSTRLITDEDSQQYNTPSCTSSIQSYVSDYDQKLSIISHQLDGGDVAADLMSLSHAAHMVTENVRMVSCEASELVQDLQKAQQMEQMAFKRSEKAERLATRLYKENKILEKQVETLKAEKKVLKREVKTLRDERAKAQQQESQALRSGMLRAMEEYVAGALQIHERHLTKPKLRESEVEKDLPSDDITKDIQENYVAPDREIPTLKGQSLETTGSISDEIISVNDTSFDTVPTRNTTECGYVEEKKDGEEDLSKPAGCAGISCGRDFGVVVEKKDQIQSERSKSTHHTTGVARAVPKGSSSKRANYKPLTFVTPTEQDHIIASAASSKHEDEKLGSRVKSFFHMSHSEPVLHEPIQKKSSLLKLDDQSIELAETKDGFDLPPSLCHYPPLDEESSPLSSDLQATNAGSQEDFIVTFDSTLMNEYVLSPVDTTGDGGYSTTSDAGESRRARSVTVSFEGNLLRSLAVPCSETPLTVQAKPSLPEVDTEELFEC